MESVFWCTPCKIMFEKSDAHRDHDVIKLGGGETNETVQALDEIVEYSLQVLQNREQEVENARVVQADIGDQREKYMSNSRDRIERLVTDLRTALDEASMKVLHEMNKKTGDMELLAQSIVLTSAGKLDTMKRFVEYSATTLPDDAGNIDRKQLGMLYTYFKTVKKIEDQPRMRVKHEVVNIIYPTSYDRKEACLTLATRLCGEVENPNKRRSFLHTGDSGIVEIEPLAVPIRKYSRDLLTC